MAGMAGMAERQKEWQNSRIAEMATYVLFMVHTNDDTENDGLPIIHNRANIKMLNLIYHPRYDNVALCALSCLYAKKT